MIQPRHTKPWQMQQAPCLWPSRLAPYPHRKAFVPVATLPAWPSGQNAHPRAACAQRLVGHPRASFLCGPESNGSGKINSNQF